MLQGRILGWRSLGCGWEEEEGVMASMLSNVDGRGATIELLSIVEILLLEM
jgi:hypothetical protein